MKNLRRLFRGFDGLAVGLGSCLSFSTERCRHNFILEEVCYNHASKAANRYRF